MYRKIVTEFWSDPEVEGLGPDAKFVLLYLLTSPLGNMSGCFPVTTKRISKDTELPADAVEAALADVLDTNIAEYSTETNEVLLKNWPKHNWNMTPNLAKALEKSINAVKSDSFREYLQCEFDKRRTSVGQASDKHSTSIEQSSVSVSVTDTDKQTGKSTGKKSQVETGKHKHGEFGNVLLTDYELDQLKAKFPDDWQKRIDDLSYYIGSKGDKYKSHYRTILSWNRKNGSKTLKEVANERYSEYDR